MVSVFVIGLGAIIGLMAVMKEEFSFNPGLVIAFTLLVFLIMLAVEGVFIWLLLRRTRGAKEAGDTERLKKEEATKHFGSAQERLLPEPVPSVTEHTTRAFEPIYRE